MGRGGGIRGYRHSYSSGSGQIGAGTFYALNKMTDKDIATRFKFSGGEVLKVKASDIQNPGLPAEALAAKWFKGKNWKVAARTLGFSADGEGQAKAMDVYVAREAARRGYKAIKYGNYELQVIVGVRGPTY